MDFFQSTYDLPWIWVPLILRQLLHKNSMETKISLFWCNVINLPPISRAVVFLVLVLIFPPQYHEGLVEIRKSPSSIERYLGNRD